MLENMKLSIIVTVYNKEPFLRRCLDSCLNQKGVSAGDYELVIINDGSTDGSLSIISEYADKYGNIIVLDQSNAGLSIARNNGIDISTGDYLWFVDADDWVSPDSVRTILTAAGSLPDVIPIYAGMEGSDKVQNLIPTDANSGRDILLSGMWEKSSQLYVLRNDYLKGNDLRFFPRIYHEDCEFTPRMLSMAKTATVIDKVLYVTCCDPNSITQVPKIKRSYDILLIIEHIFHFVEVHNFDDKLTQAIDYGMSVTLNSALLNIICFDSKEIKKFNHAMYDYRKYFVCLKNAKAKNKLEYLLFQLFPKHYVGVYKAMKFYHLRTLLKKSI